MARQYAVTFNTVAITTSADVFEITPADDKPIRIIGLRLGQYTDVGDAASENLNVQIIRGFTASGSGGSSATPAPLDPADAAAGFTAETCNSTLATTGTTATLHSDVWNTQAGYAENFPENVQPGASQANTTIVVRISAPADSITTNGTLIIEEL